MENSPKIAKIFHCENCDYTCSKTNDYNKHLLTLKHKNRTFSNILEQKVAENLQQYACKKCNKIYKARNSLWYHEKICKDINHDYSIHSDYPSDKELIMLLLKQNSELIMQNAELTKNGINNTSHSHNNTNSHNKTFNLQFFLNETCKDAMNIMEFVDSIKLQLSDLETVGKLGYVEGISNIITSNLKALDVTQRPIHCTDKKREVLYIKDENKWEKEDDDKKKLRKVIKKVASKNSRLLPKFKEVHPDCGKSASKFSDQYNKIIVESMGGPGDNDAEKEDKIIRNITKNVTIDKECNIVL